MATPLCRQSTLQQPSVLIPQLKCNCTLSLYQTICARPMMRLFLKHILITIELFELRTYPAIKLFEWVTSSSIKTYRWGATALMSTPLCRRPSLATPPFLLFYSSLQFLPRFQTPSKNLGKQPNDWYQPTSLYCCSHSIRNVVIPFQGHHALYYGRTMVPNANPGLFAYGSPTCYLTRHCHQFWKPVPSWKFR